LLVPGFGEPEFYSRAVVTTHGSAQLNGIQQNIEDVRTLSGQTATLSFWAKADSTRTISFFTQQNFGSGGSTTTTQTIGIATATTSWQRFTFTFDVPSVTGKTIGEGSSLMVSIRNNNSADGSTLDLWGVQLEAGSIATPFKRHAPDVGLEELACKRFYQRRGGQATNHTYGTGQCQSTTEFRMPMKFDVEMRSAPTITLPGTASLYIVQTGGANRTPSSFSVAQITTEDAELRVTTSSLTIGHAGNFISNSTAAIIELNSEL
jgi:hypothetical protein